MAHTSTGLQWHNQLFLFSLFPNGAGLPEPLWQQRHRWVLIILAYHIIILYSIGLWNDMPASHLLTGTVMLTCLIGLAMEHRISRQIRTLLSTIGLISSSALLVYFSGGHIGTHVHFFVMVTFVSLYQEWRQYAVFFGLFLAHHILFGLFIPSAIYDQAGSIAHPLQWAGIHSIGIIGEIIGVAFFWRGFELDQETLSRVEERLRLSTDTANIGIWELNIRQNSLYWDERMLALYGLSSHQFGGTYESWRAMVHSQDLPLVEADYQSALRNEKPFNTDFRIRRPTGEIRHLRATGQIFFDHDGMPIRAFGINYDITSQKEVEFALREQDRYLRAVLDHAVTAIIIINEQGIIETFNPSAEALFGYAATEAIGHNVKLLMPEPYHSEHDGYLESYNSTGKAQIIGIGREVVGLRKDGTEFPLDLAVSEVKLHNRRIYIGMIRDITDMKDNEAQLEEAAVELECRNAELEIAHQQTLAATRAKSAFLAAMSHEIRTPMNSIAAMTELLTETSLSAEQEDYVQRLSRASSHLLELINDVLDLSKIESGQLQLESIPIYIPDLVANVAEMMAVRAHSKRIELVTHIRSDVTSTVSGDPTRLRQILVNLLGNAIKFTEQGQVLLQVESAEPGRLRFSVSDTGIGIPGHKLNSIFDTFTQADASTTRKYGGTGLGLTICKRLVKLMGGDIKISSILGLGSTFRFTILLPEASVQLPQPVSPVLSSQCMRILVVDDNAATRLVIRDALEMANAAVTESADGTDALAVIRTAHANGHPFDLMIIDRHMPNMDGFDVIVTARAMPEGRALPILLLLSDILKGDRQRMAELGLQHHLNKPISCTALFAAISKISFAQVEQPRPSLPTAPPPSASAILKPLRILLVDDLEDNRDVITFFLKSTPYQLDMAENGEIGLNKFITGTYDLVLMDMQMPVMDGLQATRAIREWEQAHHKTPTPVVALTAHALVEELNKSLAAGCTAHLTKPITKPILLNKIIEFTKDRFPHAA